MVEYREWVRALKTSVAVGRKQHVTVTAAGLGYYAFNSLIPLLLLLTIAISIVYDPATTAQVLASATGLRATEIETFLTEVIGNGGARTRAGLIAAGIFAYSTVTMFQAVNIAFSEIYGTRKRRSGLRKIADSLLIFAIVLVALALIGGVGVALYGVAGAVLLVLTWLYLGGLSLLFGVILNAVLAGRVDADHGWLPTEESE